MVPTQTPEEHHCSLVSTWTAVDHKTLNVTFQTPSKLSIRVLQFEDNNVVQNSTKGFSFKNNPKPQLIVGRRMGKDYTESQPQWLRLAGTSGDHLVQPLDQEEAPSRGCLEPYPVNVWASPSMETPPPLWTSDLIFDQEIWAGDSQPYQLCARPLSVYRLEGLFRESSGTLLCSNHPWFSWYRLQ